MLLQPKKTKYKKERKGKLKMLNYKSNKINFGRHCLKAKESGYISAKSLESARQAINKQVKKNKGRLWIRIFPNIPITKKPVEVRMGKGKGPVHHWGAKISGGTTLFEITGVKCTTALIGFKNASSKLPIKTKIIIVTK